METSRTLAPAFVATLMVAAALAGCGTSTRSTSRSASPSPPVSETAPSTTVAKSFAWVRPGPAPAGWPVATIPTGAAMPYPPGWRRIKSDPGTASAAALGDNDRFVGYLNLTPRQGAETLEDWARFRVEHNADEREHNVTMLASATGLHFSGARGSCVRDAYTTSTGSRYIELACLVAGRHSSAVIVGASAPSAWSRVAPLLERSISSVTS